MFGRLQYFFFFSAILPIILASDCPNSGTACRCSKTKLPQIALCARPHPKASTCIPSLCDTDYKCSCDGDYLCSYRPSLSQWSCSEPAGEDGKCPCSKKKYKKAKYGLRVTGLYRQLVSPCDMPLGFWA